MSMTMQHASIDAPCRNTLSVCSSSGSRLARGLAGRSNGSFLKGQQVSLSAPRSRVQSAGALQVEAARTVENKKEMVAGLKERFENSLLVTAVNFEGLSVAEVKTLRRSLPADSKFVMAKNTLAIKACEGTQHSEIASVLKGPNALLFVEENISESLKAITTMKKGLGESHPEACLTFTGGSMEGKGFDDAEIKKLEKLPSKLELIAKVAGAIKAVPRKVAYGIKAVPNKVAYAAQAYKEKLEEDA